MRPVHFFHTVGSTMSEALRLAEWGCPSGSAVVANEQTAGMGRHGHSWHSEPGSGLYVSLVLRMAPTPPLTLALGLAARDAVAAVAGAACDLRWPNDLMLGGRKVAGILVQQHDSVAIAGIGVNVNHAGFPPDLRDLATSLRIETGRAHERAALLNALLDECAACVDLLTGAGPRPVLDAFMRASSYAVGRRVRVEQPEGDIVGATAGLDENGFLRVRRDDGSEALILAGGVRPL